MATWGGGGGTEQKAWDVAIGCWAGSGGKEKSFGMPPWKLKPGLRWHRSHHLLTATSARERPAGTSCWRKSHSTATKAPPGSFHKLLGESEAQEDELLAECLW